MTKFHVCLQTQNMSLCGEWLILLNTYQELREVEWAETMPRHEDNELFDTCVWKKKKKKKWS